MKYIDKKFGMAFLIAFAVLLCYGATYSYLRIDESDNSCSQTVNFTGTVTLQGAAIATEYYASHQSIYFTALEDVTASTPSSMEDTLKPIISYYKSAYAPFDDTLEAYEDDLKAAYYFSNGAITTDSKGSNTLSNINTAVNSLSGKREACVDFERDSSQYLTIESPSSDWTNSTGKFTMSCWINPESSPNDMGIFYMGNATRGLLIELNPWYGNPGVYFSFHESDGTFIELDSGNGYSFSTGTWYHIVFRLDGVSEASVWINGVKEKTKSYDGTIFTTAPTRVSVGAIGTSSYFDGRIDGLYCYPNQSLSDSAISSLYYSGAGRFRGVSASGDFRTSDNYLFTGWHRFPGSFTRTDDDTIVVSDSTTVAEMFKVGRPIRYADTIGTWRYGIVTAYTSGTVDLAGAALTTDYDTYIEIGDMSKVVHVPFFISGTYGNGADTDLLYNDGDTKFLWRLGKSYCVKFSAMHKTVDTGTEPKINIQINNARLSTDDSNNGIQLSTAGTFVDNSSTGINTSNYDINNGEELEIECTVAGGTGDASDLTVDIIFIQE